MTTYSQTCAHPAETDSAGAFVSLVQMGREYIQKLQLKSNISTERRQLMTLSDAMLRDIGIDRVDAAQEAMRNDIPVDRMEIQGSE